LETCSRFASCQKTGALSKRIGLKHQSHGRFPKPVQFPESGLAAIHSTELDFGMESDHLVWAECLPS
jgi:hypothetical protein